MLLCFWLVVRTMIHNVNVCLVVCISAQNRFQGGADKSAFKNKITGKFEVFYGAIVVRCRESALSHV